MNRVSGWDPKMFNSTDERGSESDSDGDGRVFFNQYYLI